MVTSKCFIKYALLRLSSGHFGHIIILPTISSTGEAVITVVVADKPEIEDQLFSQSRTLVELSPLKCYL